MQFSGRAFWSLLGFLKNVGAMLRHVSKGMWGVIAGFLKKSLVRHFLENSTLAVSPLRRYSNCTSGTSFGGALRFGGCAFSAHLSSYVTFSLKPTTTRLGGIRSNLKPLRPSQRLWTSRVSSAIDVMAGNDACVEVLSEAIFRQPRAGTLEFGP